MHAIGCAGITLLQLREPGTTRAVLCPRTAYQLSIDLELVALTELSLSSLHAGCMSYTAGLF